MKLSNPCSIWLLRSSIAILSFTFGVSSLQNYAAFPLAVPFIVWSNCTLNDPDGLDCGQIQVPLDHNKPEGERITLAIARLKAPSESRQGSLVYNPGGPGGSGTKVVLGVAQLQNSSFPFFSSALLSHYDIIGLDPRGVGLSTPVRCNPDLWNKRISMFPSDEQRFAELVATTKAIGASCANLTGMLFNHLDTTSVVKDIELVRLALNEGKLNYFGQSYGSQIGEQYAELFPENINRMAIDGIVDHSQSEISSMFAEVNLVPFNNKYIQIVHRLTIF
jgi:pimeloyl-ACP methyl ester carboxylesterase